jgi:small GTP-binding protein
MSKRVKIVVVGDGTVGKTCLLSAYKNHEIPPDYVPTVFDNWVTRMQIKNEEIIVQIWDTAGQEDLENIRCLSYANTDVFLLCFSVVDPNTLANIRTRWMPELKKYIQKPRVILVGTKDDLRTDPGTLAALRAEGLKPIDPSEAKAVVTEMKIADYLECSAMQQTGVDEVFNLAIATALKRPKKKQCLLL